MKRETYERQVKLALEMYEKAGIVLTDEEKIRMCEVVTESGAEYIKTSTGFSTGGATVEDIRLMRETVGPEMGVKASGGVKSFEAACAMIEAGASRIGASSGKKIWRVLWREEGKDKQFTIG